MASRHPGNVGLKSEGGETMRKLAILLALAVVGLPSLAKAADVVTEVCQVNGPKQLLTFIEASAGSFYRSRAKGLRPTVLSVMRICCLNTLRCRSRSKSTPTPPTLFSRGKTGDADALAKLTRTEIEGEGRHRLPFLRRNSAIIGFADNAVASKIAQRHLVRKSWRIAI